MSGKIVQIWNKMMFILNQYKPKISLKKKIYFIKKNWLCKKYE